MEALKEKDRVLMLQFVTGRYGKQSVCECVGEDIHMYVSQGQMGSSDLWFDLH